MDAPPRSRPEAVTRLPWEIVETFPSTDAELIARWNDRVIAADAPGERARALVGRALASYWAVPAGLDERPWAVVATQRRADVTAATAIAREVGGPELLAACLLGELYATWGPDHLARRRLVVDELSGMLDDVGDEELRLRIYEWLVVAHFDTGDLTAAKHEIGRFAEEAAGTELVLFRRREELWHGNLAMLEGRLDDAVRINQEAIASTADTAGSPFSFQNVAVTLAIEHYLREQLEEVVEVVRSIRASSPRVGGNWDTGLAITLAETGAIEEAAGLFERVAVDDFAVIRRDLNWIVTMHLLGLVALRLDDAARGSHILELLRPFATLDSTHGSGYASYGPVAHVVGRLELAFGTREEGLRWFDFVLSTRPVGPWTSITRFDRAVATQTSDPAGAALDAATAEREFRDFGMGSRAVAARRLVQRLQLGGHGGPIALLEDGRWYLRHPAGSASLPDGVGARCLTRLLARPGVALDVTDVDPGIEAGVAPTSPSTSVADRTLDETARRAYRRRLEELDEQAELTETEQVERDLLRRELAGAAYTRSTSTELERARVRVTKSIRRAIDAIAGQSPGLGAHLSGTVSTGRRCLHAPPDGRAWRVVETRADTSIGSMAQ